MTQQVLPRLLGGEACTDFRVCVENTFITVKAASEERWQRRARRVRTEPARQVGEESGLSSSASGGSLGSSCSHEQELPGAAAAAEAPRDALELLGLLEQQDELSVPKALAAMRGCVRRLSLDATGSRAVQLALEAASPSEALELSDELRGVVLDAVRSPNGNYVVQKVVQVLPARLSSFVAEELRDSCVAMAYHCAGSRVISRVLEKAPDAASSVALADRILEDDICKVCRHRFGRHVIAAVLEHGTPSQKSRVTHALRGEMVRFAKHQNAWLVAEKALTHALAPDRVLLAEELLAHPNILVSVARHATGQVVVEAVARLPGRAGQTALDYLHRARAKLQKDKYARQMLVTLKLSAQR